MFHSGISSRVNLADKCFALYGLYVDGLNNTLGDESAENEILSFAKKME
ncbi:hypothetical protein CHISP_3232 [Chitinispirillum alkaliphilum]|nr:hypothetical protein CHISP_3232 [Chitinispirillum alkaliphilum]